MSRVFWDSNLYIYMIEGRSPYCEQVESLRKAMLSRGDQLLTSTFTLGEVLVKPIEKKDQVLTRRYTQIITSTSVMIDFGVKAASIYASLRGDRSIRPPDAIQLACAAAAGVDLFITNDARLHSKNVQGIQFIVPLARAPL